MNPGWCAALYLSLVACGARSGLETPAPGPTDGGSQLPPSLLNDGGSSAPPDAADETDAGLPSTATCLTGGNVLSVEGDPDSWWFSGTQTDSTGMVWLGNADSTYAAYDQASVNVAPPGVSGGWTFAFRSWSAIDGTVAPGPIQIGVVYPVVPADIGQNMLIESPSATDCSIAGAFRIDELTARQDPEQSRDNDTLLTLTAAFVASCPSGTTKTGVLRGCLHYDASNP